MRLKRPIYSVFALIALMCVGAASTSLHALPGAGASLPAWKDTRGQIYSRETLSQYKATVFFFGSTQCPISNIYTPRMVELSKKYQPLGVQFFFVNPNREDTAETVVNYAKSRGIAFPLIKDNDLKLANSLHANRTPEAVMVDTLGEVRYIGGIDDNTDRTKIVRNLLQDALDAVLAGKPVKIARTIALGCVIFRDSVTAPSKASANVNYAQQVAPILYKHCVGCHRPGETGPFSLETYQQARTWGRAIKDYTARRQMPPWKAVAGIGDFHDARVMADSEIATLANWVDSGMAKGDMKRCPTLPPAPKEGWKLGKPSEIAQPEAPYHLRPEGKDVYRNFVIPVDSSVDRFINGVEFQADSRAVVHHMIVYIDLSGQSVKLDKADPEPGYSSNDFAIGIPMNKAVWVSAWAPGNSPRFLPEGTAFWLPKGSKVVLQVHYHKNGQDRYDRSRVGLHFVEASSVKKVVFTGEIIYPFLNLRPGVANQTVVSKATLQRDTEVIAVMPHMHYLGRKMSLTARVPGSSPIPMIAINDWDFNWQETYAYKQPLHLPKGTRLEMSAVYDNSEDSPRQPSHPPKWVHWGEATTDEMCIGFYQYTLPYQKGMVPIGSEE